MTTSGTPTLGDYTHELRSHEYGSLKFRADSALIRELGERLVGAPHIALAELVKNAYDADATRCVIRLEDDRIVVSDNGHGMTEEEFRDHWMTIGTRHKQRHGHSRKLRRNVSGSKGVGRLSAQFLAHRMQLVTRPETHPASLHALVDWDTAIAAGSLTEAEARYRMDGEQAFRFPADASNGTIVVMEGLKNRWSPNRVRDLGQELWMLQSPIENFGRVRNGSQDALDFRVSFETTLEGLDESFETQMQAAIANAYAVIGGEASREEGRVRSHVSVRFRDGERHSETFSDEGEFVAAARWQIRVYNLSGRQGGGVPVQRAREYFERFGVMVFDAGFRLPHYGIDSDWLGIEYDHSHRRNRSDLLPEGMHVRRALNDLPTQGRLLGVVAIDTGQEARAATQQQRESGEYLKILVTRDRLVENAAYHQLTKAVRRSLDYYALRQRIKVSRSEDVSRPSETPIVRVRRIDALVEEVRERYPTDDTIAEIANEVASIDDLISKQLAADDAARSLLGPLASAGMAALAMEHETAKELRILRSSLAALSQRAQASDDEGTKEITERLKDWLQRFEDSRRLFAPLLDPEDRDVIESLSASPVVRQTIEGIRPLVSRIHFHTDIDPTLVLPPATFAEWYALLQNVLLNAGNAMLDAERAEIRIAGSKEGVRRVLRISDKGTGIDLAKADGLFAPFERDQKVSMERRALALGGMGLGLTIVRMIAEQRGCSARFVTPEAGWKTTFELSWRG